MFVKDNVAGQVAMYKQQKEDFIDEVLFLLFCDPHGALCDPHGGESDPFGVGLLRFPKFLLTNDLPHIESLGVKCV